MGMPWPQQNLNTCLHAYFCREFGFSNHGPAVSGKSDFCLYSDAYDPYASIVTFKSKIHPTTASAEFKYLFACLFLPGIRIFKPWPRSEWQG
jgi:hypothetical protein